MILESIASFGPLQMHFGLPWPGEAKNAISSEQAPSAEVRENEQKKIWRDQISANDPSAGSPTETLLRLLNFLREIAVINGNNINGNYLV